MTEEETKKQIVLDVLQAIKAKTDDSKNFKNAGDLKLREFSDKIDLVRIGDALKDDNDNSVPIETLFHKAGILAFLFNATNFLEEGSEYNFSSNLKVSTFGKDIQPFDDFKEKKDMTRSELEKKAIQYDVALLSAYQPEVDRITGSAVQDGTGTSYRLGELDEEDYEFIKLPNDEKKTVLDSLKKRLYKIILKSYPNFSGSKLKDTKTMPVWNSLTEEEEAICEYPAEESKIEDYTLRNRYKIEGTGKTVFERVTFSSLESAFDAVYAMDIKPPFKVIDLETREDATGKVMEIAEGQNHMFIDTEEIIKRLPDSFERFKKGAYSWEYLDKKDGKQIKCLNRVNFKHIIGFKDLWRRNCVPFGFKRNFILFADLTQPSAPIYRIDYRRTADFESRRLLNESFEDYFSRIPNDWEN